MTAEQPASGASPSPLSGSRILAKALEDVGRTFLVERDQVIGDRHDPTPAICFLESGLAVSKKTLRDGRQQTIALWVPGDIIDHEALTIGEVFSTTHALGQAKVMQVSLKDLAQLVKGDPIYNGLFLRFVAYQSVLAKEWLIRLGRFTAYEKTAHLLCELFWRLDLVGHTTGDYCELMLRQGELADILGLSLVQQNRSLASLRVQGLVEWSSKGFRILDRRRLEKVANFDATYLRAALRSGTDFDAASGF